MLTTSFRPVNRATFAVTKIVIDAGHGGHDVGCLGKGGTREKDVALSIALKLGQYIETHLENVEVVYTRKSDVFVELHERAAIANNANANLFICVHCNSACYRDKKLKREICSEATYGTETWVMGLNKSDANLEVSKRENEVVLLEKDYSVKYDGFNPNSPEADIIFSLYQNTFMDQSLKLASLVQSEMKTKGRPVRGVKQAGFLVLYKTSMPSILIETGFLTNASEEKYLGSSKGQDEVANAIYKAIRKYKSAVENGVAIMEPDADEVISKDTAKPADAIAKEEKKEVQVQKSDSGSTKPESELFYTVQILTSPGPLGKTNSKFRNVEVWEEKVPGMYKYCTGRFPTFADALTVLNQVKAKGFTDAFVAAYRNGQRITLQQAKKITSIR